MAESLKYGRGPTLKCGYVPFYHFEISRYEPICIFLHFMQEGIYYTVKQQILYALISMEISARDPAQCSIWYVPSQNIAEAHFKVHLIDPLCRLRCIRA